MIEIPHDIPECYKEFFEQLEQTRDKNPHLSKFKEHLEWWQCIMTGSTTYAQCKNCDGAPRCEAYDMNEKVWSEM